MKINPNDIKKGERIQLNNGWFATMMDNKKGSTRYAEVEGYVTETGSIYAADIAVVIRGDEVIPVEATKNQKRPRDFMARFYK